MVEALRGHREPVDPGHLREETGLSRTKLTTALGRLEDLDAVELGPTGAARLVDPAVEVEPVAEAAAAAADRRRALDRSRVEMMRAYAENA